MVELERQKLRKFVIQKHTRQHQPIHWDLMLQVNDALQTYRLQLPPEKLKQKNTAVKISDHPLRFLIYEGSVNKGLGSVQIADCGTYELLNETDDSKKIQFHGNVLKGIFTLIQIEADNWEFTKSEL